MSGNSIYRSHNAAVLSVAAVDAPEDVPSSYLDEQLAETLDRLGLRPGMLENARASANPILPELRLLRKRTGSIGSRVGPAVISTLIPFALPP